MNKLTLTIKLTDLENIKNTLKIINNDICKNGFTDYNKALLNALLGEDWEENWMIGLLEE